MVAMAVPGDIGFLGGSMRRGVGGQVTLESGESSGCGWRSSLSF